MYTNQEAFDLVVEKLVKQGKPSVENGGTDFVTCLYQDSEGNRCAAGHLIPDDLIGKACQIGDAWRCLSHFHDEFSKIVESNGFVARLQLAHDLPAQNEILFWRRDWVDHMRTLAEAFELDSSKLAELATPEWQSVELEY